MNRMRVKVASSVAAAAVTVGVIAAAAPSMAPDRPAPAVFTLNEYPAFQSPDEKNLCQIGTDPRKMMDYLNINPYKTGFEDGSIARRPQNRPRNKWFDILNVPAAKELNTGWVISQGHIFTKLGYFSNFAESCKVNIHHTLLGVWNGQHNMTRACIACTQCIRHVAGTRHSIPATASSIVNWDDVLIFIRDRMDRQDITSAQLFWSLWDDTLSPHAISMNKSRDGCSSGSLSGTTRSSSLTLQL